MSVRRTLVITPAGVDRTWTEQEDVDTVETRETDHERTIKKKQWTDSVRYENDVKSFYALSSANHVVLVIRYLLNHLLTLYSR